MENTSEGVYKPPSSWVVLDVFFSITSDTRDAPSLSMMDHATVSASSAGSSLAESDVRMSRMSRSRQKPELLLKRSVIKHRVLSGSSSKNPLGPGVGSKLESAKP